MLHAMDRRGINHGPEAPGAALNACSTAGVWDWATWLNDFRKECILAASGFCVLIGDLSVSVPGFLRTLSHYLPAETSHLSCVAKPGLQSVLTE